jgi:hypothetical protein
MSPEKFHKPVNQYLLEEKNEEKDLAFDQYFDDRRHDPGSLRPCSHGCPDHGTGTHDGASPNDSAGTYDGPGPDDCRRTHDGSSAYNGPRSHPTVGSAGGFYSRRLQKPRLLGGQDL